MWSIVEVLEGLKHIRCVPEHLVLAAQQKAFEEGSTQWQHVAACSDRLQPHSQ